VPGDSVGVGGVSSQRTIDLVLVRQFAKALDDLDRDLEGVYRPALCRLASDDAPGAKHTLSVMEEDFEAGVQDLREVLAVMVRARDSLDLWTFEYWRYCLTDEACGGPTDSEVLNALGESGDPDTADTYARYLAGKLKAAEVTAEDPDGE
jgi:hypothetical protein